MNLDLRLVQQLHIENSKPVSPNMPEPYCLKSRNFTLSFALTAISQFYNLETVALAIQLLSYTSTEDIRCYPARYPKGLIECRCMQTSGIKPAEMQSEILW
jgi:hypothetical protein